MPNQTKRLDTALGLSVAVTVLSTCGLIVWLQFINHNVGNDVYDEGDSTEVMAVVRFVSSSLERSTTIALAAFGAIGFIVTLLAERRVAISRRARALMTAGLALLAAALLLSLIAQELILQMVASNAFSPGELALRCARWAIYICITAGAVCCSSYAIEATHGPPTKDGE